jgi:endonuclease/exonuclease/phosphatase family metal-dependent hydrolase
MLKLILNILLFIIIIIIISQKRFKQYTIPKNNNNNNNNQSCDKLNIITYNIQKFPWSLKTFNDIKLLLEKYDIILLQECFSLENNFSSYYIYRDSLKGINLLSSGLVILSKYPIDDTISIQFKNYNKFTLDYFSNKGFIVAPIIINNNIIYIINTHLQSSTYTRYDMYAIMQLCEIFNYIEENKLNFILCGDFNIDINDMKIIEYLYKYKYKYFYPQKSTIY